MTTRFSGGGASITRRGSRRHRVLHRFSTLDHENVGLGGCRLLATLCIIGAHCCCVVLSNFTVQVLDERRGVERSGVEWSGVERTRAQGNKW